jgi:tetratricopeptide (TPR) repeat protein
MNCKEFNRLVVPYTTDDDFDEQLADKFREHYLSCDECWAKYEQQLRLLGTMEQRAVEGVQGLKPEVDRIEELYEYAETLRHAGNHEAAIGCLEEALKLKPGDQKLLEMAAAIREKSKIEHSPVVFKEKIRALIGRISQLVSEGGFLCTSFGIAGAKGAEEDENAYSPGEPIFVYVEAPDEMDGYVTIFHYDEEDNLQMVFPSKITDKTFLRAGEEQRITIGQLQITGKHYLKALWTSKQVINPVDINFGDELAIADAIESFLESIHSLGKDEWLESVAQFEVVES